jgi:DNA-binding transcriptional MerR regulator
MLIGQLARLLGVHADMARCSRKIGPIPPPPCKSGRRRVNGTDMRAERRRLPETHREATRGRSGAHEAFADG